MQNVEMITARHDLSPEEKRDLAGEIALTVERIETLSAEKKASAQDFKQRIDAEKLHLTSMSATYQRGWEMREQPAVVEKDYATGEVVYYHAETGIVLQVRPMAYEERQQHFEFEEGAKARGGRFPWDVVAFFEGGVDEVLDRTRERVTALEADVDDGRAGDFDAADVRVLQGAFARWRDGGPAFTDVQHRDVLELGRRLGRLVERTTAVE